MKRTIAIIGFTAACIGASEMLSAKICESDLGITVVTPVHPFTDLDQRYVLSSVVVPFEVPIGILGDMRNIKEGCSEEVGVDLFINLQEYSERKARDGLRYRQCPIGNFPR